MLIVGCCVCARRRFDGGTGLGAATVSKMVALKQRLQPQAVTFGGCDAMPVNSVAWVGTESGIVRLPSAPSVCACVCVCVCVCECVCECMCMCMSVRVINK